MMSDTCIFCKHNPCICSSMPGYEIEPSQGEVNFFQEALGSWYMVFASVLHSRAFNDLGFLIQEDRKKGIVYPEKDRDIFYVFRKLPFYKVKVVVLGQDIYHDGSYTGLAFANHKDTKKLSPSLRNVIKEVKRDIYKGDTEHYVNPDLEHWAEQGVLLVNTGLTVKKGEPGSYIKYWTPFIEAMFRTLSTYSDIIYMLWGNYAQSWEPQINPHSLMIKTGHPSPLNRTKPFVGSNCFSECNTELIARNKKPIVW